MSERAPLPVDERCLTEVDNLNRHRLANGEHSEWAVQEVFKNLVSATKEGGIPNAVHVVEHDYTGTGEYNENGEEINAFMWLGRTAIQNAESGRAFHKHAAALERVEVEVEEARDAESNLRPGVTKIFISPRMTEADASYHVAKSEHLGDDDQVRISSVIADASGNIQKRRLESLLVRDIPIEAWVAMLEDPNNMFGKSIGIEDADSALSVMKVHRELEIPTSELEEGAVSVIAAVAEYIEDPVMRMKVEDQLARFREDQEDIDAKAVNIARRWQEFELELADSLHSGLVNFEMERFISVLQREWSDDDLSIIDAHRIPGTHQYRMSRSLAVILEQAKQNLLWTRAGIVTDNQEVIKQIGQTEAAQIKRDEMFIQIGHTNGYSRNVQVLEAQLDRQIASSNVEVGRGCGGSNNPNFKNGRDPNNPDELNADGSSSSSSERSNWGTTRSKCVVDSCPTRPGTVKVGPCGVCMDRCQKLYDSGKDPSKMGKAIKGTGVEATNKLVSLESLVGTADKQPKPAESQKQPQPIAA